MRTHHAWPLCQRLIAALHRLPRTLYRGISRFPLMPLPSTDPAILKSFTDTGCDVHTNFDARLRFFELVGDDIAESDFDGDLLPDLDAAREVFSLLESPDDYEIIRLVRESFLDDVDCLGFDVGYWGGDHYSIICDSAVRPTWHPPRPESFEELAGQLTRINEHFLFGSPDAAASFRSWYLTQDWAETEMQPGEFCVIQLAKSRR